MGFNVFGPLRYFLYVLLCQEWIQGSGQIVHRDPDHHKATAVFQPSLDLTLKRTDGRGLWRIWRIVNRAPLFNNWVNWSSEMVSGISSVTQLMHARSENSVYRFWVPEFSISSVLIQYTVTEFELWMDDVLFSEKTCRMGWEKKQVFQVRVGMWIKQC
jgi:hypothetical protein